MSMSVGKDDSEDAVLSEINTTPLVDVMLVLLIIFLITIPVVTTSIKVDLPKQSNLIRETKPDNIVISVDTQSNIYWFDQKVTKDQLLGKLRGIAKLDPQPEVHIRGDFRSNYEGVGKVLYAVQKIGIVKIGFITEPPPKGG
jgi:biopolymer transport protein ExbD